MTLKDALRTREAPRARAAAVPKGKRPSSLKRRIILILIAALALLLLGGEAGLRIARPVSLRTLHSRINVPRKKRYVIANERYSFLDKPAIRHSKNSLGFRGPAAPLGFAERRTIIVLGGSTTECFLLGDGKDWPGRMGRKLAGEFPNVWVNNAGFEGHSTFGHLILLRDYICEIKPKYTAFLVGADDIATNSINTLDQGLVPQAVEHSVVGGYISAFRENSYLLSAISLLLRRGKAESRGIDPDIPAWSELKHATVEIKYERDMYGHISSKYLAPYKDRIKGLVKTCREAGIVPCLITQPLAAGSGTDETTGVNLETVVCPSHVDSFPYNGKLLWNVMEMYNEVTRSVASEENVFLIDLARKMPKGSRYFYDALHFSNIGADKAAEIVARDFAPLLKSEQSASPDSR